MGVGVGGEGGGEHTDCGREGSFSKRSQAVQGGSMTRGGNPGWFCERKELCLAEAGSGSTTHAICNAFTLKLIQSNMSCGTGTGIDIMPCAWLARCGFVIGDYINDWTFSCSVWVAQSSLCSDQFALQVLLGSV